jgi:hypothetical protein
MGHAYNAQSKKSNTLSLDRSAEAANTKKTLFVTGYSLLAANLNPEAWDLNPVLFFQFCELCGLCER